MPWRAGPRTWASSPATTHTCTTCRRSWGAACRVGCTPACPAGGPGARLRLLCAAARRRLPAAQLNGATAHQRPLSTLHHPTLALLLLVVPPAVPEAAAYAAAINGTDGRSWHLPLPPLTSTSLPTAHAPGEEPEVDRLQVGGLRWGGGLLSEGWSACPCLGKRLCCLTLSLRPGWGQLNRPGSPCCDHRLPLPVPADPDPALPLRPPSTGRRRRGWSRTARR